MSRLFQWYQCINLLSVDVSIGAVISAVFFAKIFNVHILFHELVVLGLTVWIIYTSDHLIDAYKLIQPASSKRHLFHQHHFKILLSLVLVAVLVVISQIAFIHRPLLLAGIMLALLVVVYFFIQHKLLFLKEMVGALLYTGGVLLIPLSAKDSLLTFLQLQFIVQFGLVVLTNLLLFSWFDWLHDQHDRHHSFTTTFGEQITSKVLLFLIVANAVLTGAQFLFFPLHPMYVFTIILMQLILLIIFFNQRFFENNDRYRILGDAVFLLPIMDILM